MAGDDSAPNGPVIPSWQQATSISESTASSEKPSEQHADATAKLDLVEHARRFLDDDSIRNASRERKEAYLKEKGVPDDQIQKLVAETIVSTTTDDEDLKTVHESTSSVPEKTLPQSKGVEKAPEQPPQSARVTPRSDIPPIITYPEFLLKPEKPPPLVTVERLASAAYLFAGVAALTYGASQYLVQPMLESLTSARHDLYSATTKSLDTLNTKLESSVSHVPYIPSLHSHKEQYRDDDEASIDSDPTELFHRDIATQTSPAHSRSSSISSSTDKPSASAITDQANRLSSLHTTLSSLLSATQTHFSENSLQDTLSDFQNIVTSLEGNNQPLTVPYNVNKEGATDSQAAKFKAEIRALKGAFLSSRNFPTVRPAMPFTMPSNSSHPQATR